MSESSGPNSTAADQPMPPMLEYRVLAPDELPGPRPRWVYVVVIVYLILLAGILSIPAWGGLLQDSSFDLQEWSLFATFMAAGFSLIIIPVRAVGRRPVTRRSLWIPVIGSGLLAGLLILGGGFALAEFANENFSDQMGWTIVGLGAAVWLGWSIVFMIMAIGRDPNSLGMRLHRLLIAGSVLELLIAVPTHVIVRRRTDCCAGMMTGLGICIGVAVMLAGFGPSVLFLYYRRRRQIMPPLKNGDSSPQPQS